MRPLLDNVFISMQLPGTSYFSLASSFHHSWDFFGRSLTNYLQVTEKHIYCLGERSPLRRSLLWSYFTDGFCLLICTKHSNSIAISILLKKRPGCFMMLLLPKCPSIQYPNTHLHFQILPTLQGPAPISLPPTSSSCHSVPSFTCHFYLGHSYLCPRLSSPPCQTVSPLRMSTHSNLPPSFLAQCKT